MPREGHDPLFSHRPGNTGISIHVPREGHDLHRLQQSMLTATFQSTCPARGTTCNYLFSRCAPKHFNPRAPRGARPLMILPFAVTLHFNPRAPRGARLGRIKCIIHKLLFQSTCPARGTTSNAHFFKRTRTISIHVPRAGHDIAGGYKLKGSLWISIHVPREGHD